MKKKIITLLNIILTITFIFSGYKIIMWNINNTTNDKIIDKINDKVIINTIPITTNTNETTTTQEPNIYYDYTKLSLIDVDFSELKKINKDTKGWIQVKGTNINYPYVQTKNNDYYLTRSFDKKYTDAGWVFMDYRNNPKDFGKNTIIYAHARKNNTMFGELDKLLKKTWYSNPDNHFINISTETHNSVWQIFSVYHIPTTNDYIQTEFTENEFKEFVKMIKNRSSRKYKLNVTDKDKILTLSTCYNDTDKLVVHAKLINMQKKETQ